VSDDARAGWPAVEYEEVDWQPRYGTPMPRAAQRRHRGPYHAAVPPAIAGRPVPLSAELAAVAEDASAEVARFDAELGGEIGPFSSVLLRSESVASSRIENLTASARSIAEAELQPAATGNARLIVANTRMMESAIDLADHIDERAIIAMHAALLSDSTSGTTGSFRDEPVWIGGSDYGPHGALFIPPRHERIVAAIEDLISFIDRDDVPVLVHAAIAHAQFETIHPFTDGNGRTGRALLHAQLRNKGLTRTVTVPISAGLLSDTDSYFAALMDYRAGELEPLITRVAAASFAAVANGRELVEDLRRIRAGWTERVTARRDSATWTVADALVRRPVINSAVIASELGIAPANTYRLLEPLVEAGVVVVVTGKKRDRLWRSPEVLDALDRFAERAGRRVRASS